MYMLWQKGQGHAHLECGGVGGGVTDPTIATLCNNVKYTAKDAHEEPGWYWNKRIQIEI